ncbi:hypothetical protein BJV74DRAFT_799292 [Russula compacta]|nr:hypothetical protein BJV74DRAFT_799292 [Russula compacta]
MQGGRGKAQRVKEEGRQLCEQAWNGQREAIAVGQHRRAWWVRAWRKAVPQQWAKAGKARRVKAGEGSCKRAWNGRREAGHCRWAMQAAMVGAGARRQMGSSCVRGEVVQNRMQEAGRMWAGWMWAGGTLGMFVHRVYHELKAERRGKGLTHKDKWAQAGMGRHKHRHGDRWGLVWPVPGCNHEQKEEKNKSVLTHFHPQPGRCRHSIVAWRNRVQGHMCADRHGQGGRGQGRCGQEAHWWAHKKPQQHYYDVAHVLGIGEKIGAAQAHIEHEDCIGNEDEQPTKGEASYDEKVEHIHEAGVHAAHTKGDNEGRVQVLWQVNEFGCGLVHVHAGRVDGIVLSCAGMAMCT